MTLNIYQPDLINKMTQGFNEDMKSLITFNTPDTPHQGIVFNQETDTKISYGPQKRYRSGLGLLQYLSKYSQPELSNAVREISKYMDKSNIIQYKALLRAIKYVIDKNTISNQLNHTLTSMYHGNYMVIVMCTTQEIMTLVKA